MCKIVLKFEDPLTHKEMMDHRESCEKGAGIMGWHEPEKSLMSFKALSHKDMWSKYCQDKRESPFWLFHSRLPSMGDVTARNIQPFHGKETIGFCHNGTVSKNGLLLNLAAQGEYLDGTESDSYMLYRLLRLCHVKTVRTLLDDYGDNFVFVHVPSQSIHIIGKFKVEQKGGKILSARNVYGEPRVLIECGFDGSIKTYKKEKPYIPTRYFSGNGGYRKGELERGAEELFCTPASSELEAHYEHLEGLTLESKEDRDKAGESNT